MIDLRDPRVLEALIGRPSPSVLTPIDRALVRDQSVLITGGGGSIGSALAHEVAACRPARLTIVEQCELNLFDVERTLTAAFPNLVLEAVLGDVTRRGDLEQAFQRARPDVVYHAAAYKHVTMTERALVPTIRTNVFGTLFTLRAAQESGARFVLISTDKAAEARSVMGASKRLAELVTIAERRPGFEPIAVRFGNILGSSGSLVPLVLSSLREGRTIQVTHPEATRYFMSPQEAVSLVIKSDLMGPDGQIYMLDMGQPIRVLDLVERLIAMGTPRGQQPPPIEFIGLRPGEKLQEQLSSGNTALVRSRHPRIFVADQTDIHVPRLRSFMELLGDAVRRSDSFATLEALRHAVPEYEPSSDTWNRELSRIDQSLNGAPSRQVLLPFSPTIN
jgi:FlaA1/EpsC-like NDP-sugar epimerase